jgi:hypothetical protein
METFKRLIIIGVLAAFGPVAAQAQSNPTSAESRLANFSRIAKAAGESISFITSDGMVREGLLVSASADAITMKFAGGEQVFSKSTIASVERMRDTTGDGALTGAAFGALLGVLFVAGGAPAEHVLRSAAVYGVIGWALDAANTNRQPLYRASSAGPTLRMSIRF